MNEKTTSKKNIIQIKNIHFYPLVGLLILLLLVTIFDLQKNTKAVDKYNLWLDSCYLGIQKSGEASNLSSKERINFNHTITENINIEQ